MLAPQFGPEIVGGHPIVLAELAAQLQARGWQVVPPDGQPVESFSSYLSFGQRWALLVRAGMENLPAGLPRIVSRLMMPRAYYAALSGQLHAAERQLRTAGYEVVLVHVDGTPPGLSALAAAVGAARGRPVVLVSLYGLAEELRAPGWGLVRGLSRAYLGPAGHPLLFQPVAPAQVHTAIFASAALHDQALQAGWPPQRARTIYYGVPLPPAQPRPAPGRRLLWVGRLAPEKGLHILLAALPALRARLPGLTVTAIAAQGTRDYRQLIERQIRDLGLTDAVTLCPPVPRADLAQAYARHDALFFHSPFAEPVALVLMEAFAAGLPAVSSAAAPGSRLVQPGVTCLTYEPRQAASLVEAVHTLLTDAPLRARLAANAERLVRAEFSLPAMGAAYDAVLRAACCCPGRRHPRRPAGPADRLGLTGLRRDLTIAIQLTNGRGRALGRPGRPQTPKVQTARGRTRAANLSGIQDPGRGFL